GAASIPAQIKASHGIDGATLQTRFDTLSKQGYQVISISVYGSPSSARYAAVFRKQTGPARRTFWNRKRDSFLTYQKQWAAQGYKLKLISVCGSGASASYAGVLEKDGVQTRQVFDVDTTTFHGKGSDARDDGYILTSAAIHGPSSKLRYTGIWKKMATPSVHWNANTGYSASSFGDLMVGYKAVGVRPSLITLCNDQRYLAIWRDDRLSGHFAHHNLTHSQYQTLFDSYAKSGYWPMSVQGGGIGTSTRYAAVFVKSDTPLKRSWNTRGTSVTAFAPIDTYFKGVMQDKGVRAGSIAIVKDARLVYARGYTWAENSYPVTQPTDLFRIASMSKPLTSIAIHQLIEKKQLTLNDKLTSILSLGKPKDARTSDVQVRHLLSHFGGWDREKAFDPVSADHDIADKLKVPLPLKTSHISSYMTQYQDLQSKPGDAYAYSNYGFLSLGRIIEAKTGQNYKAYMKTNVFGKLGLTRPKAGLAMRSQRYPNEVRYHPLRPQTVRSVVHNDRRYVPRQYGGFAIGETYHAFGGWILSAPDYAKILAAFDMGTRNPLLNPGTVKTMFTAPEPRKKIDMLRGWKATTMLDAKSKPVKTQFHSGSLSGTSTTMFHRDDGISVILLTNTDGTVSTSNDGKKINDILNKLTAWPQHDLFASTGIPPFRSHVNGKWTSYGKSCAVKESLKVTGKPQTEQTFGLRVTGANAKAPGVYYVGVSKSKWGSFNLPFSLSLIGMGNNCWLNTSIEVTVPFSTNSSGSSTSMLIKVPAGSGLVGSHLYAQATVANANVKTPIKAVMTNAVDVTLGGWR
ncbi:MAG: serine hydrolase, partial [Planctomycetota bacterium]|nr:serine hydrolase [Planctomycetota bacterium]